MSLRELPAALEPVRAYLERAEELAPAKPVVSHFARVFAMELALGLRAQMRADDMGYMLALMESLEAERKGLEASKAPGFDAPEATLTAFAVDLHKRAKASDKPELSHPQPTNKWTIVEAPKVRAARRPPARAALCGRNPHAPLDIRARARPQVARCFHASAVILDCVRQFTPALPPNLAQIQSEAHSRSQALASALARALSTPPCVPIEWRPAPAAMLKRKDATSASAAEAAAGRPTAPARAAALPTAPSNAPTRPSKASQPPSAPGPSANTSANISALAAGDDVWYFDVGGGGVWREAALAAVHFDAGAPYYTVRSI